jgi:hypothetical protein
MVGVVGDKRRRFDPELGEGAVRIVEETGEPVAQSRGIWGSVPTRCTTG